MVVSEDSGGLEFTAFERAAWTISIVTGSFVLCQSSPNSKYWLARKDVVSKPANNLLIFNVRFIADIKESNIEGSIGIDSSNSHTKRRYPLYVLEDQVGFIVPAQLVFSFASNEFQSMGES